MLSRGMENAAEFYQALAIQMKGFNGSATRWRQSDQACIAIIPCEMIVPALAPRVVKGNEIVVDGIDCLGLDVLMVVTALARQGKILQGRRATTELWHDMLHRERLGRERRLTPTILATTTRPPRHRSSLRDGDATRHMEAA